MSRRSYLGFPSSCNVHGDGLVVVGLAGGDTTGPVVVLVTIPTGKRYGFIGYLTWQLDGIDRRVEPPWLLSKSADSDPEQFRQGLLRATRVCGPSASTRRTTWAAPLQELPEDMP